jgi:hypothetical protein
MTDLPREENREGWDDAKVSGLDRAVPVGLLAAWVVNDIEEWVTLSSWSKRNAARIQEIVPVKLPEGLVGGISERQARLAIGLVGAGIMAATISGVRSGLKAGLFRSALLAFGLHGFTHLAQSAVLRSYTPGVATAATVVIPFWVWARRFQRKAGHPKESKAEIAAALAMLAGIPAVVALAGKLTEKSS